MDTLHITLFGHVTVIYPNHSAPLKLSRGSQALLAYLLLQPHLVPREVLMEVFWADSPVDRAQSNLTTALWRLRQSLEPATVQPGTYLIASNTGEIGFNWKSSHWLDIEAFEQQICAFLRKPLSVLNEDEVKGIEGELALYRGDLLEGLYDDWALRERERFRLRYLSCLTRLMEFHAAKNNFEQSITYGHEIIRRDPLREETHRDLMRMYLERGQRTLAIRQYGQCRDLLHQELGVPPLEETQMLYHQIRATLPVLTPATGQPMSQEIAQLSHELQLVKRSLDDTTRALMRIAQSVNRIMGEAMPGIVGKQKH